MRLSLIFELLLIFVLLAFAASRVIDSKRLRNSHRAVTRKPGKVIQKTRQDVNRYCSCSARLCNCCREFNIPVVAFQGPGCASLQYLSGDRLAISMSFGERVLTNTTISGRKPRPVCMPLPGGVSKFCGRVYNIGRQGEDFKACLGLELRALQDIEASLRVSCFRFGPKGLKAEPAQPLPVVGNGENTDNNDDDDDDDDEDDDDYDFDDDDYDNDVDSADYTSFNVFDDDFVGGLFDEDDSGSDDAVPVRKPVRKVVTPTGLPAKGKIRKPSPVPTKVVNKLEKQPTDPKPFPTKATSPTKKVINTMSTTDRTVVFPLATAVPTIKPEESGIKINFVSSTQSEVQPSAGSIPSSPHESIAAVTAMLQELPGQMPQVGPVDTKLSKLTPDPALDSMPTPVPSEVTTDAAVESVMQNSVAPASLGTTLQGEGEPVQKYETTTLIEKTSSNDVHKVTIEEGDEHINTESSQNLILKSETYVDDDDDDDDENDDDEDDALTYPLSSVVEEVLGEDNDNMSQKNKTKNSVIKNNTKYKESQDMLDDIVDGVVETITGEEIDEKANSPSNNTTLNNRDTDDDEDDVDDHVDIDDEDDDNVEEDDDDEGDDEDKARANSKSKKDTKTRQSKNIRLDWLPLE